MDKKNSYGSKRRNHIIEGNSKKQYKRIESVERIRERWQTSIERQWSSLYREKDIYPKQPEDMRANSTR